MASMFQFGTHPWLMLCVLFATFVIFYMAQWEEFHTGTMYLGYFGVTELHLLTTAMYLASYWFGPGFWMAEAFFADVPALGIHFSVQYRFFVAGTIILGAASTFMTKYVLHLVQLYTMAVLWIRSVILTLAS
jgi:hypothetical protein